MCSSYSSGSQEVHKDEHENVEEVSDPSIANQDLPPKGRRLYRPGQIARGPAELRWTHNKIQRFFPGGQSLQDVAASLREGAVQPSELPMIGIVRHEMKWYSRNNRRLWCFKAAKAEAVEVCMSSVGTAFSARSDDTDHWFECDFHPTITVQGVSHRVRQPKKVCAATNVSERKSIQDFPFDLEFDEEDMKPEKATEAPRNAGTQSRERSKGAHWNEQNISSSTGTN